MSTIENTCFVPVPSEFLPHLGAVLVRFTYLYQEAQVEEQDGGVLLSAPAPELLSELCAEFNYLLYREKILRDTTHIREALYRAIGA